MRYEPFDKRLLAKSIKRYVKIERHYRIPTLTLSDVAEHLGVARSTVIKTLHDEMSMTFLEYVTDCRLHHAHRALTKSKGRFTLEHIAFTAGFGSVNTMNKKYIKKFGERPYIINKE